MDQEPSSEMLVLDLDLEDDLEEHTAARQDEFGVLKSNKDEELEELKEKKVSRGVIVTRQMTLLLTLIVCLSCSTNC